MVSDASTRPQGIAPHYWVRYIGLLVLLSMCGCAGTFDYEKGIYQTPDQSLSCKFIRCCYPWKSKVYICTEPNTTGMSITFNYRP